MERFTDLVFKIYCQAVKNKALVIRFPQWKEVLAEAGNLSESQRDDYARAICISQCKI